MATASRRIIDPNDPQYIGPDSPDYINDPNAPIEPSQSGPIAAPPPEPTIEGQMPAADAPQEPTGTTSGGAIGITELPDGAGGTVAVPPPELAPPATPLTNPIPWEQPIDVAPWDSPPEPTPWAPEPQTPVDAAPWTPEPVDTSPAIPLPWEPPAAPLTNPIPIEQRLSPTNPNYSPPITAAPPPVDVTPSIPLPTAPVATPVAPPTPLPWEQPITMAPTSPIISGAPMDVTPSIPTAPIAPISTAPVPPPGAAVTAAATQQPVGLPDFSADENIIASQILPTPDPRMLALQQAGDTGLDRLAQQAQTPILPSSSPRTQGLQEQGDQALQALANEAPIAPQADPRLLRYQQETDGLMDKILKGPDRLQMAKGFFKNFTEETEGDYRDSLKDATDEGAAHGQLFSGQLTNKYGDLSQRRARDQDSAKNRFLNEALRETFGDRDRAFSQLGDVENRIWGQGMDERGELRTERDNRRRVLSDFYGERDKGLNRELGEREEARGERSNQQGTVNQYYNERDKALVTGRSDRNETRDERDYQQTTSEAALLNRIRQYQAEQAGQQQDFNNAGTLNEYGNEGDPTNTYMTAAEQASLESAAAAGDTGALLKMLAMRNG